MAKFGIIPPEPRAIATLDECCPLLQRLIPDLLTWMMVRGSKSIIRESIRTDERQLWLHGFGREYDDGRGIVTNATTARDGWHFYGCAVDVVHERLGDDAPLSYYDALADEAERLGLAPGWRWKMKDGPHVQVGPPMLTSPSDHAAELFASGGRQAIWQVIGAL